MFIYEISLIPLNHHVWFITVLVLFGVHQSLGATHRFFFHEWLRVVARFAVFLPAVGHWTPCSFLSLNDAALQMHSLRVRMLMSVSPWLQAYDYVSFSVSLVTSIWWIMWLWWFVSAISKRAFNRDTAETEVSISGAAEFRFSIYFLSKYFLYFWHSLSCHFPVIL